MSQTLKPKKGYKKVEGLFGKYEEIPDEWEIKKINCLGKLVTGTTPSTSIREYYGKDFLWATPTDLRSTKYIVETETKLSKKGFKQTRRLPKNSIMVTCIGNIGRTGFTSEEMATNQQINSIITNNVDSEFTYYSITYNQEKISNFANQSVVPIINKKDFGLIKIKIPKKIIEQQNIASILSNMDNLITNTHKIINQTKSIKKGLMQKLLTKGIGHTKFKKVKWLFGKTIEIPEEWEVNYLEQISNIFDSLHVTPEYILEGFSMVRSIDIKYGNLKLENTIQVSKEVFKKFTRNYKPQRNDIVMSRVGTYFVTSFVNTDKNFCMGQNTIVIHPSTEPFFLYSALNSIFVKKQIEFSYDRTAGQKTLSLKNIKKLKIFLPLVIEQQKIASILSNVDSEITSQTQYKEKLERLKKSLMQKLLTGQIRVTA